MLWSNSRRLHCVSSSWRNFQWNIRGKCSQDARVNLTMAIIRQEYWIPCLRRLTKRVIKGCNGCKRFQAITFAHAPTRNLPMDRTEGSLSFQVSGVNYAAPIKYRTRGKGERKAYIVLHACSLTRGLYMELLTDLSTEEFLASLKCFVPRHGWP